MGLCPPMGTPQEPQALLHVPSHGVPSKDGWILASPMLDTTARLALCGYPHSQSSPTSANLILPLAAGQAHERCCGTAHGMGAGSILYPGMHLGAPGERAGGSSRCLHPVGYHPACRIPWRHRQGHSPCLSPGDERAAPGAGTAPCLQPKACGRPAASAAAGTNACTYLCPGTGVCSSLPRL